jgi:hypothetical protein
MINIRKLTIYITIFCLVSSICYSIVLADEVDNFTVDLSDNQVGHSSEYNLEFILSSNAYSELKNGSLRLTFPSGFDINNIDSITITDNIPNIEYDINRIEIEDQMLSLFFSQENNTANKISTTFKVNLNLNLSKIINTPIAGEYQLSAVLVKSNGQIIAGPELSDPFTITSGALVNLKLIEDSFTPSEVTTGANISFNFDILNESNIELEFIQQSSIFELTADNFNGLAFIFNLTGDITPGENSFYSGLIAIPSDLDAHELEAKVSIAYKVPGFDDIRHFTFTFSPITLIIAPAVQVSGLEIIAPNSPFANTSQTITIKGKVINHSEHYADNLTVQLKSIEGYSSIIDDTQILSIPPMDTTDVFFEVLVSDISHDLPEQFELNILNDNMVVLPPFNNQTFLFIDKPAILSLDYRLNGIADANNVQLDPGEQFIFTVELANIGDADVSPVNYRLIIDGLNILPDTSTGQFDINNPIDFIYNAPIMDKTITFSFDLLDTPIDMNSNTQAPINRENFQFVINVSTVDANLVVTPQRLGVGLVIHGELTEITELHFDNTDQLNLSDIQLGQFRIKLIDSDGNTLLPAGLVDITTTGFYENEILVSTTSIDNEWIVFSFNDIVITPTTDRILVFAVQYNESDLDFINTRGSSNGLSAIFVSGPFVGQPARIDVFNNEPYLVNQDIVFVQNTLANSFIIEDNPFNPRERDASFTFYVDEPANVEFRIFTLTGEEVYFRSIPEEEVIANSINLIDWDGKNSKGRMVRNGVYISYITNTRTGESARVKIALVK